MCNWFYRDECEAPNLPIRQTKPDILHPDNEEIQEHYLSMDGTTGNIQENGAGYVNINNTERLRQLFAYKT